MTGLRRQPETAMAGALPALWRARRAQGASQPCENRAVKRAAVTASRVQKHRPCLLSPPRLLQGPPERWKEGCRVRGQPACPEQGSMCVCTCACMDVHVCFHARVCLCMCMCVCWKAPSSLPSCMSLTYKKIKDTPCLAFLTGWSCLHMCGALQTCQLRRLCQGKGWGAQG